MNGAANSLGGSTGGSVATGNPQNIGSQNIANTQSNLQTTDSSLLNGTQLRLTDQNGQPIDLTKTTATSQVAKTKPQPNHRNLVIGSASALLIAAVFVITWLMSRPASGLKHS